VRRLPPEAIAEIVLLLGAAAVLLSIVIINLPEKEPAPPSIECVEWREYRQEYKGLGDAGGFETCVRYGESNEQR
jgi:hypothetical protein